LSSSVFTVVGVAAGVWCPRIKTQVNAHQPWQAAQKVDAQLQSHAQRTGEVGWLQGAVVFPGSVACAHNHKDQGLSADERMPLLAEPGLLRPYTVVVFDSFSKAVRSLELWAPSAAHAERAQATAFCLVAGVLCNAPSPAFYYQPQCRGPWSSAEQRAWSLAMSYDKRHWQSYRAQRLKHRASPPQAQSRPLQPCFPAAPTRPVLDSRTSQAEYPMKDGPQMG